jgi:hypothetical protein
VLFAGDRQNGNRPRPQRGHGKPEQLFPSTHRVSTLIEIVALRQNVTMYL